MLFSPYQEANCGALSSLNEVGVPEAACCLAASVPTFHCSGFLLQHLPAKFIPCASLRAISLCTLSRRRGNEDAVGINYGSFKAHTLENSKQNQRESRSSSLMYEFCHRKWSQETSGNVRTCLQALCCLH